MSSSAADRIRAFRALHTAPQPFVMPNPWDAGSARLLQNMGFPALATSSAAAAWTLGRGDYRVTRDEALGMAQQIVEAVTIPVSGDLENGFGASPETVAETVRLAGEIGLAGCSIEDAAGDEAPYDIGLATERVVAAMEAARSLPEPIVITARAENYLRGVDDLDDTIARLQAFALAGADVLFAPGLPDLAAVRAVCAAVDRPVSVIGSMAAGAVTMEEFAGAGVQRVSLATAFHRAAMTGLRDAAREVLDDGRFGFVGRIMSGGEWDAALQAR